MRRWRWIEHDTIHDGVAGKAGQLFVLRLVHVDEHIVTGDVVIFVRMIAVRAGVVSWRGSRMSLPLQNGFARVLPAAPFLFEVTSAAQRDFVCDPTRMNENQINTTIFDIQRTTRRHLPQLSNSSDLSSQSLLMSHTLIDLMQMFLSSR